MSVTFEVSKEERSSDASEEHSRNMQLMSVTLEVSRLPKSIDSRLR